MTTAIIGVGNIGGAVARHLVHGGEPVIVAAGQEPNAAALAAGLGPLASAATVPAAIAAADTVVLAVWFDALRQVVTENASRLDGKVVIDPSNPIGVGADGTPVRTIPDDQSLGSQVAAMLPAGAHYVKAFGTLDAGSLASNANRAPRQVVLFYATDDDRAAATAERLIRAAGFDAVKAGGLSDVGWLEAPGGELHMLGGLGGRMLDADQARAAVAAA